MLYSPSVRPTSTRFQQARLVSGFSTSLPHARRSSTATLALGLDEFDHAPQPPDKDLPVTRLGNEIDGALVERHAFVGIQGIARREHAAFVLFGGYDLPVRNTTGSLTPCWRS